MAWTFDTRDKSASTLRSTIWLTALMQAGTLVAGLVMAWQAIECAGLRHHGDSALCTVGVMVNYSIFWLAAETRQRARDALAHFGSPADAPDTVSLPARYTASPKDITPTTIEPSPESCRPWAVQCTDDPHDPATRGLPREGQASGLASQVPPIAPG